MRGKNAVTGRTGGGRASRRGVREVFIPEGYAVEEWLDMSDTMEGEEPETEEEVRPVHAEGKK